MQLNQGEKESYSICGCLSLSGLCWAGKTGNFILGTLIMMIVELTPVSLIRNRTTVTNIFFI